MTASLSVAEQTATVAALWAHVGMPSEALWAIESAQRDHQDDTRLAELLNQYERALELPR